jgi:ABC-type glutathione transport system ATPase component
MRSAADASAAGLGAPGRLLESAVTTTTAAATASAASAATRSPLLEVRGLGKAFALPSAPGPRRLTWRREERPLLAAVDDVSFTLARGEALGLVGESGSGKSTTAALVARLTDPDQGRILFEGQDIAGTPARRAAHAAWRPRIQMVFQDPGDSLDPRASAFDAIAQPLRLLKGLGGTALRQQVLRAAERTQLAHTLLDHRPHQLSGGQAARVGIARAIALAPSLLILDEPTSALDVSVQIGILQLLDGLRRESGVGLLFVSHDLQVVRLLCQRVLVMQQGRVVESGPTDRVFDQPAHPYSAALAAAVPRFAFKADPAVTPAPRSPLRPIENHHKESRHHVS